MNPKRNFVDMFRKQCLERVAVGATGLLNNEQEAQFHGFDNFRKKTKYFKRVAVGAMGLLNNEPEAQFRGFDILHLTKLENTLSFWILEFQSVISLGVVEGWCSETL